MKIKFFILIMVVTLITQILPTSFVNAALPEPTESELRNVEKLTAIGIFEKDDYVLYSTEVTRGQFVKYALRAGGFSETLKTVATENPFKDINENTANCESILTAYAIGMISGGETFRPNDIITYAEASKILMFVLGYGDVADLKGGYPMGYITIATQLGIFKRAQYNSIDDGITFEALTNIILRTLDTKPLQIRHIVVSDEDYSYIMSENNNETLLWATRKIGYARGIVEENMFASLYGATETPSDYIKIDGIIYEQGNTNAWELIGRDVEIYYLHKDENDTDAIIYAAPRENKNRVYSFLGDQIMSVSNTVIEYWDEESDDSQKINLSNTLTYLYNMEQKVIDTSTLKSEFNEISLIDNNADGDADVLSVVNYSVLQVASTVKSDYAVTDSLSGKKIILDPEDSDYRVYIEKDGIPATFDDIEKDDIISYCESVNNSVNIKIVKISSKKVTGTIETVNAGDLTVVIDGEEYKILHGLFKKNMVSVSGTFSLDIFDRIVSCSDRISNVVYGYLNALGKENGLDAEIKAKIFTENGRWVELKFRDKIHFNGNNMTASNFYDLYGADVSSYRQLITYEVNKGGEIVKINFPLKAGEDFVHWSETEKQLIEDKTFRLSKTLSGGKFRIGNNSIEGQIGFLPDVKIFFIPSQPADEEDFKVKPLGGLISDRTYYNILGYNMDETGMTDICVMEGNNNLSDSGTSFFVVAGHASVMHEGEILNALELYYGVEKLMVPIKDDKALIDSVKKLETGDIITCSIDDSGKMISMDLRMDISTGKEQKFILTSTYAKPALAYGKICSIDAENERFSFDFAGADRYLLTLPSNLAVYIYDSEREIVIEGSIADLEEDLYCFASFTYYNTNQVLVIK